MAILTTISTKEALKLHSSSEDFVIGGGIALPESFSCGAAPSRLFINDECSVVVLAKLVQLVEEGVTCGVTRLVVGRLNHNRSNWRVCISLRSNGTLDRLECTRFSSCARRILD